MNVTTLSGVVDKQPEIRYFESGAVKAQLSIRVRHPRSGDDNVDWFDVEAWGKVAELIANYVPAKSRIAISGSLRVDSWTDKSTGKPRSKFVVVAREIDLPPKNVE